LAKDYLLMVSNFLSSQLGYKLSPVVVIAGNTDARYTQMPIYADASLRWYKMGIKLNKKMKCKNWRQMVARL
jgi:hypothetical protein